jgi:hypothetical protein
VPFNGGNKEEVMRCFSPATKVARGDDGGGGALIYLVPEVEERGRVGQRGRAGRRGYWADWAKSCRKFPFGIKVGLLNLPRLLKFVKGDLGGILMWGFFLNSSRFLRDFRKI